jgi:2-hydroxy-3-keto-5-methylthiopentenyl-1-phosphate phosphatase
LKPAPESDIDPALDQNAQLACDEETVSSQGDNYSYSNGIDETLEPITAIREAFEDLVKRLKSCGPAFIEFLNSLKNRKIRIATMCSGTESPILALDLVAGSKNIIPGYLRS